MYTKKLRLDEVLDHVDSITIKYCCMTTIKGDRDANMKSSKLNMYSVVPFKGCTYYNHIKFWTIIKTACVRSWEKDLQFWTQLEFIWDTESDGVGGTHALALMREWGLSNLATGETLQELRGDSEVKAKIICSRSNFLIAFEPKSCDRNCLQELLTLDEFNEIRPRLKDF
ncbi:hypothetical protein BC830DRAFT_1076831 [Chytriomyces sp. MP71]|nr:hypothetical protein BC830DRAFT_1076831 [Chytriomyces sp. MP71]